MAKIVGAWRVIETEPKTNDTKVGDILLDIHYIYSPAHVTECEPHIKPKHLKEIGMGPNDLAFARHHVDLVPLECVISMAHQPVRFEVLLPVTIGNRKSPVHVQPIQGPPQSTPNSK